MAEVNARRVTFDKQGKITRGFKPMPEGSAPKRTPEELAEREKLRAEMKAERDELEKMQAEENYQQGLKAYRRGDARAQGFGFKPRAEDLDPGMPKPAVTANPEIPAKETDSLVITPKGMKKGGNVSASKRGDGIAQRGKTKGRYI